MVESECALQNYQNNHNHFIEKRVSKLKQQIAKRKAEIIACPLVTEVGESELDEQGEQTKLEQYFSTVKQAILTKHQQHHSIDNKTGINVSFGVVRIANILPCIELTKYLLQADFNNENHHGNTQVRVMAYHSQQVLLLRHEQEKHLDAVLKRKEKSGQEQQAFSDPVIRNHLDNLHQLNGGLTSVEQTAQNVIFILVATPVEEVGRDHDFDWAIVEPSSYRSIVQLAGRVRRHRVNAVEQANIGLMQYNIKAFKANDKAGEVYFTKPGYEDGYRKSNNKGIGLLFHDLTRLINEQHLRDNLNAIPRIKELPPADKQVLAAVEHKVTAQDLANYSAYGANTLQGYLTQTWYLTALPQVLTPFRKSEASVTCFCFITQIVTNVTSPKKMKQVSLCLMKLIRRSTAKAY